MKKIIVIAAVLALATGGANAVTTTYSQTLGAAEGKSILFEGVLTANDEITFAPKLAFPGITLDDIPERASFFTTSYGVSINNKGAICVGMHESRHYDGEGHCDKLALQCAVDDGGYTKCVLILLTNGGDGVYVKRVAQYYVSGSYMYCKYYAMNSSGELSATGNPKGWSTSGTGYQLAGLRICGVSPTAAGKADVVAFPGATLADIKDCNFNSFYRFGKYMTKPATNNVARYVTVWPSSANPQKLVMQFTNPNDSSKVAVIQMTNGVGGVYAFQSHYAYDVDSQRFTVNSETGAVSASGGNSSNRGDATDDPPQYQVHGIHVLPPCVKKTPNKTKAWAGKTLDDIKDGTFTARMCGSWMGLSFRETPDSAVGYNKKVYADDGGSVTNIIVEFQVRDGSSTKCLVVSFENGEDGVYASAIDGRYSSDAIGYTYRDYDGTWHGTAVAPAEATTAAGYGVFDLRVAVEEATEWILDQDRTWSELRNGATLSSDEVVRIKVTGLSPVLTIDENVAVAKIEFVNALAGGVSTNSVAVSGGATVTFGTLALGQNACAAVPGPFVPASVSLDAGSRLVYASGEAIATTYSGLGAVEVAPGATLFVDSDMTHAPFLNNGAVVKRVAGTVLLPFDTASTGVTIVSNGTLKVASVSGSGDAYTVRVTNGATFDTNGLSENTVNVVLEGGAKLVNSNAAIGTNKKQTTRLALEGDATATASQNFGLIGSGYSETTLALGSNTLTLDGTAGFWLCNTTITGDGTVAVNGGTMQCLYGNGSDVTGENCTVNIGASGKLRIDNGVSLTVKNFYNGGTINAPFKDGNAWYAQGTLVVTGELTSGNTIPILTLADGATVKASASAAQTVSTTFNASGTITIDASAITSYDLREAENDRIPVLTVPADPSGATWELANGPTGVCKWVDNGDGTFTLFLYRRRGVTVILK